MKSPARIVRAVLRELYLNVLCTVVLCAVLIPFFYLYFPLVLLGVIFCVILWAVVQKLLHVARPVKRSKGDGHG